jgi:outer membrane receptor protein involved in Fe transport
MRNCCQNKISVVALTAYCVALGSVAAAAEEQLGLEEVIVTAQKRGESIQDVPMAVQSITAETLERFNYTSLEDYAKLIPTLDFDGTNLTGSQSIRLRGVSPTTGEPTVAFYFGETPLQDSARTSFPNPAAVDVARIEVLRGPQGNLYGASSMGGVIKIVPNAPDLQTYSQRYAATTSYTEDGDVNYSAQAVFNAPLANDRLALRASAFFAHEGGFVDRVSPYASITPPTGVPDPRAAQFGEKNVNDSDQVSLRLAALWAPTDWLGITPSALYQRTKRGAPSEIDAGFDRDEPTQIRRDVEDSSDEFVLLNLLAEADLKFATLISSTSHFDRDVFNHFDFSQNLVRTPSNATRVLDELVPPMSNARQTDDFIQEVRFSSDWSFPLSLLGGLYYADLHRPFQQTFVADGVAAAGLAPSDLLFVQNAVTDRTERAAFANLTFSPLDRLELQAGARWFDVRVHNTRVADGVFNGGFTNSDLRAEPEEDVNLAFTASYDLSANRMVYARAAQGFRPGFTFSPPPRTPTCDAGLASLGLTPGTLSANTVESDSLWNYELGVRTDWADGRLRVNATAFQIDYSDIQQSVPVPGCGFNISGNVGSAESNGLELEVFWRAGGLELGLAAGYVDAFVTADAPNLGATDDEPLTGVPELTLSFTALYVRPAALFGRDVFVRSTYRYVDERTTDFGSASTGPTAANTLDDYNIVDVAFGVQTQEWEISLFADNATNAVAEYSTLTSRGPRSWSINQPRTIGVSVSKRL